MISTGELRKGVTILLDGELMKIIDYSHNKTGRGSAVVRINLRNARTGANTTRTFMAGEKFQVAQVERKKVQFLYRDGDEFHFMDQETYDQPVVKADVIGDAAYYLKENQEVDLLIYEDEAIDIGLPPNVEMTIVDTEPGYKGDTASGGGKPATTDTGLVVTVPIFLSTGEVIRVDTRNGEYIERVG
jgi:elongation factor P